MKHKQQWTGLIPVFIFLTGWLACHTQTAADDQWNEVIDRNKMLAQKYDNFYRIIAETTTSAEATMAQARQMRSKDDRELKKQEAIAEANPLFLQRLATFQPRMDSIEVRRQRLIHMAGPASLKEAQQNAELARRLASESHMNLINPLGTVKQASDLCERIDKLLADAEYTLEEGAKRVGLINEKNQ